MKRKIDDKRLREIVRARITKGDAFRLDSASYTTRQQEVAKELASMSRMEIFIKYDYATYDITR